MTKYTRHKIALFHICPEWFNSISNVSVYLVHFDHAFFCKELKEACRVLLILSSLWGRLGSESN